MFAVALSMVLPPPTPQPIPFKSHPSTQYGVQWLISCVVQGLVFGVRTLGKTAVSTDIMDLFTALAPLITDTPGNNAMHHCTTVDVFIIIYFLGVHVRFGTRSGRGHEAMFPPCFF